MYTVSNHGAVVCAVLWCPFQREGSKHAECKGRTALHYAAESGHAQIVDLLLSANAKITNDQNLKTALDIAVDNLDEDVIRAMITHERLATCEACSSTHLRVSHGSVMIIIELCLEKSDSTDNFFKSEILIPPDWYHKKNTQPKI